MFYHQSRWPAARFLIMPLSVMLLSIVKTEDLPGQEHTDTEVLASMRGPNLAPCRGLTLVKASRVGDRMRAETDCSIWRI